ncbi:MAG: hypothetical protein ACRENP_09730 [Longimicrobiales bacterium]
MKNALIVALVSSACAAASVNGQQTASRLGVGASYENFSFRSPDAVGVETVALFTLPLAARVRLSDALAVEVSSAWASGRLKRADHSESTISGPTDTELRVLLGLGNGLVTITGIAQLPTGSASLSLAEADVAGLIAADVLPFGISNWGSGGGAGLNATFTRALGDYAAGVSVGYVMAREFEPLENSFQYRPGNQLSVRGALDRTFANSGKASVVITVLRYAADEIDNANLFQAGNRYEGLASYAFALGSNGAAMVYAGYLHRDEGEFLGTALLLPVEGLLFAGTGLEFPSAAGLLRPRADVRVLRRDNGVGQGYTASAGADLELGSGRLIIVPSLRGRFGNILLREAAKSRFTGFDIGLSVRFGG